MPEAFQTAAATRLRGISLRQIRLGRGLVLLSYLISHFLNHALGNISIIAMGAGVASHAEFWQWPPIAVVFYGAAATHAGLGIWALFERRQFHHRAIEPLQLILGLSIPVLIVGMRLGYFGLLGLALLGRAVRSGVERRVGMISLSYGHDRIVRVPVGLSVLEASLRHRVPHASVRGEVTIGGIGYRDHLVFTALGDTVNVAARLQDMTKDLACEVIVSEDVCRTAGLVADQFPARQVTIRGRLEPMTVRAVADARMLSPLDAGTQL